MNFISDGVSGEQIELKYCERCGGLFLRMVGARIVQCAKCAARLTEQTRLTTRMNVRSQERNRRPVRLSRGPRNYGREMQGMTMIDCLQGTAAGEARVC